ncbi:MAG: biopolymer transporter ExbD [Pirellulaceae bacterium]|nr:biopolymer transporter ExbD [Pirellulaceae bacterium]
MTPLLFVCPVCQQELSAKLDLEGTYVNCPSCETQLVVPTLEMVDESPRPPIAQTAPLQLGLKRKSGEAEMDMTPMVDVTFLLLIFFMVTAVLAPQMSMQVPPPSPESPSTQTKEIDFEDDPDSITVYIDPFNTYQVIMGGEAPVEAASKQELLIRIREGKNEYEAKKLIVIAHIKSKYQYLITALDAGHRTQIEQIFFQTTAEEDGF